MRIISNHDARPPVEAEPMVAIRFDFQVDIPASRFEFDPTRSEGHFRPSTNEDEVIESITMYGAEVEHVLDRLESAFGADNAIYSLTVTDIETP